MGSVALWTRIAARHGVLRTYAAACVVEAIGVAGSVMGGAAGLLLGGVLLGGTFVGITALGLVAARGYAPHAPKRVIGLMTASFGVGQIIGPLVAGAMRDATGSFLPPSLLAAAALCVAAVLGGATRRAR
jgi:cyanate permease